MSDFDMSSYNCKTKDFLVWFTQIHGFKNFTSNPTLCEKPTSSPVIYSFRGSEDVSLHSFVKASNKSGKAFSVDVTFINSNLRKYAN